MSGIEIDQNPLILKTNDFHPHFSAPPDEDLIEADMLLAMIENDCVVKIYAMNFLPGHNYLAIKLKYYWDTKPCSQVIKNPTFKLIKFLWELNNPIFYDGIKYYIKYNKSILTEFNKQSSNIKDANQWFIDAVFDGNEASLTEKYGNSTS